VYVKLNNPAVIGGTSYVEVIPESMYEDSIEDATQEIADENSITTEEAKEDYYAEIRDRAIENEGIENPLIEALQEAIDENTYDDGKSMSAAEILQDLVYEEEVDLSDLEDVVRKAAAYAQNAEGELASS